LQGLRPGLFQQLNWLFVDEDDGAGRIVGVPGDLNEFIAFLICQKNDAPSLKGNLLGPSSPANLGKLANPGSPS
jgi:hypothetical protein